MAIIVDLPKELSLIRKQLLEVKKEINNVNPSALCKLTYRSYKPVLLIKHRGLVTPYDDSMVLAELEPGTRRTR